MFLPFYQNRFRCPDLSFHNTASTLLLALPSGIIIHIVQFSRCAFQPLLRSDFSIQLLLGTEIQAHLVVGQSGLEPPTSRLSVVCSSQLSYWPGKSRTFGGGYRTRTGDPLLAKQVLSQLSSTPVERRPLIRRFTSRSVRPLN